jgi:hypothetical protein
MFRWKRFSLRFLLILVAMAAGGMWWNLRYREFKRAQYEADYAAAAYETGTIHIERVVAAFEAAVKAEERVPFHNHNLMLAAHRNRMEKLCRSYEWTCHMPATEADALAIVQRAESLRARLRQAEQWLADGRMAE